MTFLEELTAMGERITIAGVEYTLSPLTATDWAEIHAQIIKAKPDPVVAATALSAGQPPEIAREILLKAYDDSQQLKVVTAAEIDTYRTSLVGKTYEWWLSLRRKHPDMSLSEADAILQLMSQQFFTEALAALRSRFPGVTWLQVLAAAKSEEDGAMAEMIARLEAMPEGNLEATETPGQTVTPESHSTGPPGSTNSDQTTVGPTENSPA